MSDILLNNSKHPDIRDKYGTFFTLESALGLWIIISAALLTIGVLVHINLNYVVGIVLFIDSLVILLLSLIGGIIWFRYGENHFDEIMNARRILLYIKFFFLFVFLAIGVWTSIVMIQKISSKSSSSTL
jgi:hypothetical protein